MNLQQSCLHLTYFQPIENGGSQEMLINGIIDDGLIKSMESPNGSTDRVDLGNPNEFTISNYFGLQ